LDHPSRDSFLNIDNSNIGKNSPGDGSMWRQTTLTLATFGLGLVLMAGLTDAAEPVDLKVGDKAPGFEALDDTGKTWKSSDYLGKKFIVVYFYPADCTGGCTKQAQGFRDDMAKLAKDDVVVVGVSGDTVESHVFFKKKESLNFNLLADVDGKVASALGVPFTTGEKEVKASFNGEDKLLKRNVTTKRWTFVIGKDGKILAKNTEVKAAEDSKAVAEVIAKAKA
jgi:thioredoxin-dependent peroxiredoxin